MNKYFTTRAAVMSLLTGSMLLISGQRLHSQEYERKDLDNLALNNVCFDGGDAGHREKLRNWERASSRCEDVLLKECPPNPSLWKRLE